MGSDGPNRTKPPLPRPGLDVLAKGSRTSSSGPRTSRSPDVPGPLTSLAPDLPGPPTSPAPRRPR